MKAISVRGFTTHFEPFAFEVQKRGKTLGTWTPAPKSPEPIDVMKRLKRTFERPLPFTGLDLLKESKQR
jgi:hypothetical protein